MDVVVFIGRRKELRALAVLAVRPARSSRSRNTFMLSYISSVVFISSDHLGVHAGLRAKHTYLSTRLLAGRYAGIRVRICTPTYQSHSRWPQSLAPSLSRAYAMLMHTSASTWDALPLILCVPQPCIVHAVQLHPYINIHSNLG